jgi:hypothetical protein
MLSDAKDLNKSIGTMDLVMSVSSLEESMIYQLGWTTLPGLRGLSVSEFRATPTSEPDNEKGIAAAFANDTECDAFLHRLETDFAPRRFSNAADAFDTVKAYVLDRVRQK